jgi:hypothetical protein
MLRPMSATERPRWVFRALAIVWLTLCVSPVPVSAQPGVREQCWTSSGNTWWTTIVLKLDTQGICVVDQTGGQYAATIETRLGMPAVWHVCNACNQKVDLRLTNFTGSMTALLPYMSPFADSSNSVTRRNIDIGMQQWMINAQATLDGTLVGSYDYDVRVKLPSESEAQWRSFHPQIQIDRDGTVTKRLAAILGLAVLVSGVGGFALGRRRK